MVLCCFSFKVCGPKSSKADLVVCVKGESKETYTNIATVAKKDFGYDFISVFVQ